MIYGRLSYKYGKHVVKVLSIHPMANYPNLLFFPSKDSFCLPVCLLQFQFKYYIVSAAWLPPSRFQILEEIVCHKTRTGRSALYCGKLIINYYNNIPLHITNSTRQTKYLINWKQWFFKLHRVLTSDALCDSVLTVTWIVNLLNNFWKFFRCMLNWKLSKKLRRNLSYDMLATITSRSFLRGFLGFRWVCKNLETNIRKGCCGKDKLYSLFFTDIKNLSIHLICHSEFRLSSLVRWWIYTRNHKSDL